jgi:hypothetical protein
MFLLKGVYVAKKKNGSLYYRASITYKSKHISLGSYSLSIHAHEAYKEAYNILFNGHYNYSQYNQLFILSFEKWIILHNYRDNGYYFKNPIYLHKYHFSYFLSEQIELKFDADDLFYYSNHKIFKRNGYLFVNDYGMQVNILSRYGIKNHAVLNKDYYFVDQDPTNFRYHNIEIINQYTGVTKQLKDNQPFYIARININGSFIIGKYLQEVHAAIAYNKAADYINQHHISDKEYTRNYIADMDSKTYKEIYAQLRISNKIIQLKKD